MENFFRIFPHNGKIFSTVWEILPLGSLESRRSRRGASRSRHEGVPAPFRSPWQLKIGYWILNIGILSLFLSACAPATRDATLTGATMGTTYTIRLAQAGLDRGGLQKLQAAIDAALDEVNRQMSPWRPDSEIAAFNRAGANEPVAISPDFQFVVRRALEIAEATGGAFDPTVGALVALWGFGSDGLRRDAPAPDRIAAARAKTGWRHLALTPEGQLLKDLAGLQLDLGAIAKGFGVDRVAALLRARGLADFLVEIGGETLAEGTNASGLPWRVGVLRPDVEWMMSSAAGPGGARHDPNSPSPSGRGYNKTEPAPAPSDTALHGVVRLTGGRAVATSGDYRDFYRDETGELRSHIIDPRTAAPAGHAVASVSVLANDCLTADALATALFVLGPQEGQAVLARSFPGVEALFLLRQAGGSLREIATPGFAAVTQYHRL